MKNKTLRNQITNYLSIYLSKKDLQMKPIMYQILKRIKNDQQMTYRQFLSIIKFLERERPFVNKNRSQIFEHFKPLIIDPNSFEEPTKGNNIDDDTENTLEPFFL